MGRVTHADADTLRRAAAEREITVSTLVKHILHDAIKTRPRADT
jgi:hypothetical protein